MAMRFSLLITVLSAVYGVHMELASVVRNITQFSSPWIRPVRNQSSSLSLYLNLHVLQIIDVNEKEESVKLHVRLTQRWRDEFMSWDSTLYEGLPCFTVPSSMVWSPAVSVKEAIGVSQQHSEVQVQVESSGWTSRVEDLVFTLHCDLVMLLFPFDQQKCNVTFYPQLHTEQDVVLNADKRGRSEFASKAHGEWDLMEIKVYSYSQKQRSHLSFQVKLERYSLFYVLNLMVPSALVMLVDMAAFAVPIDCPERIPFKVTLLFGYTVFLLLLTDVLPPFRDTTPMLGVYLVVCLVLLCVSMGESVLLLTLGQPDSHTHSTLLEKIMQRLCPHLLETDGASLKRSFTLEHGRAEPGAIGEGCVIDRLRNELEDVSEELRMLNWNNAQRTSRLRLMEAVDQLCFRVYTLILVVFVLCLTLLWTVGR